ncbi:MAG: hypothetical protein GX816_04260 [Erysipelotrichia bacterium]|jgi:Ca2+/Na+ antiporter|nr:hypothetical protein [Erysipelotrichia bacterium]
MNNDIDNSSFGGGFALGFLLGLIGLIIAFAIGGRNIRRGAGYGLLTYFIIYTVTGIIVLLVSMSGGY